LKSRAAIAKVITLAESTLESDQLYLQELFQHFDYVPGRVIAWSGAPGSGKSTLMSSLGKKYVEKHPHLSLFFLLVDPSSEKSGGSILGDKTRMSDLVSCPNIFIRPQASQGAYGGVSPSTSKVIETLFYLGFQEVWIETVGVGQSESAVWSLCDYLAYVVAPGAGDDLQAMKRGLMEYVDFVVVNKMDIDLNLAKNTAMHYKASIEILQKRTINQFLVSAFKSETLNPLLEKIEELPLHSMQSADRIKRKIYVNAQTELMEKFRSFCRSNTWSSQTTSAQLLKDFFLHFPK
jgi:LAO/AO transport system kinase